jgi:O-antigen/teichoic acid export membrane protein
MDVGLDRVLTERLAQRSASWSAAWSGVILLKGSVLLAATLVGVIGVLEMHSSFLLLAAIQAASVTVVLTTQTAAAALGRLPALAVARIGSRLAAMAGIIALVTFRTFDSQFLVDYSIVLVGFADILGAAILGTAVLRAEAAKIERDALSRTGLLIAIGAGLPLGIANLAVWLYTKLDTIILAAVSDLATVGVYTAAVRLAELLGGLPTALNSITLSALAELWSSDTHRFRLARNVVLAATATVMGFLCLLVFLLSEPIVSVTYHIPSAELYLKLMVWGQIFAACSVICGLSLQVSQRSSTTAQIALLLALVSIPTYGVAIAVYGAIGAAAGTTLLYAAIVPIGLLLRASREVYLAVLIDVAIVTLAIAAAFAPLLLLSLRGPLPLDLQVVSASITFVTIAATAFLITRRLRGGFIR